MKHVPMAVLVSVKFTLKNKPARISEVRITAYMYTMRLSRSTMHVLVLLLAGNNLSHTYLKCKHDCLLEMWFWCWGVPCVSSYGGVTHMQVSYIPLLICAYALDHLLTTRRVMLGCGEYNSHLSKHHCLLAGLQESFMLCRLQTHGLFKLVGIEHYN